MRAIDADALKQDLLNKSFYPAIVAAAIKRAPTVDPTVYVAYAHHINTMVLIIGVYRNLDDARRACGEWENEHVLCDWTEWESFEVK